jgi:hypothetical protein
MMALGEGKGEMVKLLARRTLKGKGIKLAKTPLKVLLLAWIWKKYSSFYRMNYICQI